MDSVVHIFGDVGVLIAVATERVVRKKRESMVDVCRIWVNIQMNDFENIESFEAILIGYICPLKLAVANTIFC